jgi:putative membrane protein
MPPGGRGASLRPPRGSSIPRAGGPNHLCDLAVFDGAASMSDLNDPRVFFAAERTLLAWNRSSLALMAFGFVIERFGLFMHLILRAGDTHLQRGASFWIGLGFVLLGAVVAISSSWQYRKVVRTLKPIEIPQGYTVNAGPAVNLMVAVLGLVLLGYLFVN